MENRRRVYAKRHQQLEAALAAVQNGEMTASKAAQHFDIPPSTLYSKVNGKHAKKIGRPTSLTKEEEEEICDILLSCMKIGVPLNKRMLMCIVRAIGLAKGIDEAKFGNRWHRRYLQRHKEISLRVISALSFKKSREWTFNRCEEWIKILQGLHDRGFMVDPEGIWNLDESGFQLAEMYDKAYAQKGSREVIAYYKSSESDRDNISLLAVGNAAGRMLRPLILYKGKTHIASHFKDTNNACWLSTNSSGFMDVQVLQEYLEKEFLPSLTSSKNVLFLDGHSSHVNCVGLFLACMKLDKEVEVVCLPAGQTAFLQPLDKKVFGGVKQKWTKYLQESRLDASLDVSRHNFPAHIVKLWTPGASEYSFNLAEPLKDGFEKTGLYPFSPELLRSTVDPNLQLQEGISSETEQCYEEIHDMLRNRLNASVDKTASCLIQIKQILHGGSTGSIIATEFHKHLLRSAPKKKRKEKDSRLSTDNGRVLTDETYILGKQEQLLNSKKKAASKGLKNRKRNLSVLDKAADIVVPVMDKAVDIVVPVLKEVSDILLPAQMNVFARIASVMRNKAKDADINPPARKARAKKIATCKSDEAVITPQRQSIPAKARKTRAKKL